MTTMAATILILQALLLQGSHVSGRAMLGLGDMGNGHRRVPENDPSLLPAASPSPAATSAAAAVSSSRPALGFPLGTALILFLVFGVSTVFSCCYHWEKIRSHTSRLSGNRSPGIDSSAASSSADHWDRSSEIDPKCSKQSLSFPVLMPGDQIPTYVAWPSPSEARANC